jgi:hypothetical protein
VALEMHGDDSVELFLAGVSEHAVADDAALFTRTSSPPYVSTAAWIRPSACCQSATFAHW